MGRESKVRKERICRACKQSIHAGASGLVEHAGTCGRMAAIGMVTPGLITGQAAIDTLNNARAKIDARKHKRLKPRWS